MIQRYLVNILLVGLVLNSSGARALTLSSGPCAQARRWVSQAAPILWQGQVFILAPADFVWNDSSPLACHTLTDPQGGIHTLRLKRYDWAAGLALLQSAADDPIASPLSLKPNPPRILQKVQWPGGSGLIVAPHSLRHQFAGLKEVLEVKGSAITAQDVGQPILDPSGAMIGVTLSQFVEEVPGAGSRIVRWLERPNLASTEFLVLPAADLETWLTEVLSAGWQPRFQISAQEQLANRFSLLVGGLQFTEDCPPPGVEPGEDPNYPIGGGDLVGIGGGSLSAPACNFKIAMAPVPTIATVSTDAVAVAAAPLGSWLTMVRGKLDAGLEPMLKGAYSRDPAGILQSVGLVSLGHLGQVFLRTDVGFVLHLNQVVDDPRLHDLRDNARHVRAEVSRPWGLINMRQRAFLYASLALSDDWQVVQVHDMEALLESAKADPFALLYVPEFVQKMLEALKALRP